MTKWITTLTFLCLGILPGPAVQALESNIYQDAIPHLKACVSLISEREELQTATAPVDLREVCPTLANFLTYEPISEIDPPLENQTNRAYLASLIVQLEAAKQGNNANLSGEFSLPKHTQAQYMPEPAQKPFFLALAQWTFFHLQNFLIAHTHLAQPKLLQSVYIVIVNLIMVFGMTIIILYGATAMRRSQWYVKHFKQKWQHIPPVQEIDWSLDEIAGLNLDLQIPALIRLIKQRLQQAGLLEDAANTSNAQLLRIVTQAQPQHARDMSRLIRLYDRLIYSRKTVAADEINHALSLARLFLNEKEVA